MPLLPTPPFLFAITLRHPNEAAWAERLPLRLLLTLTRGGRSDGTLQLISDRDRDPVLSANNASVLSNVLSICGANNGDACFIRVPELNILVTGFGSSEELTLQLLVRCKHMLA